MTPASETSATMALQGSLLDQCDELGLRGLGRAVTRRHLDHGAWVDIRPGWLTGSDELFAHLRSAVDWRGERRWMYEREVETPRLLRFYAEDERLPHPLLPEMRDHLSAHYASELGEPFVTAGLCLYRDGRDSVAWHGDREGRSATADTMVAIVSVGAPRPLTLRPRGGGSSIKYLLGHGDLVVMGGSCQRTWDHAVPKVAGLRDARISIQFRTAGVR